MQIKPAEKTSRAGRDVKRVKPLRLGGQDQLRQRRVNECQIGKKRRTGTAALDYSTSQPPVEHCRSYGETTGAAQSPTAYPKRQKSSNSGNERPAICRRRVTKKTRRRKLSRLAATG